MATKWSREETLKLILNFQSFQLLWDVDKPEYRDRVKKNNAIFILAKTLNKTTEDITKKIHNLRCQLQGEVRKIKLKQLEGVVYKSSWEYFDHLKFLLRDEKLFVPQLPTTTTITTANSNAFLHANMDDALMITCKPDITTTATQFDNNSVNDTLNGNLPEQKLTTKRRLELTNEDCDSEDNKDYNGTEQEIVTKDEYSVFGDYLASELRGLAPTLRKKLKVKIQRALIEVNEENIAEMSAQPKTMTTILTTPAGTTVNSFDGTAFQILSATQARQLQQQTQQQQVQTQQQQQSAQQRPQQQQVQGKVEYCQL